MKIKKFLSGLVAGALALTTLASVSSFGSFADVEPETPLIPALNCKVKYQTKPDANGGTDIRFVAEVKDADILYADSAEWYIEAATADAPEDFEEIETQPLSHKAYKSLIASGKKVTAPEGYSYVISNQVGSFNEGDQVYGEIFMLNFGNACYRIATIGQSTPPTPDSSSEDSSEVTPSGEAQVIWEGELELKNWNAPKEPEMEIPDVEVGGIFAFEGTPITEGKNSQVQIGVIVGEDWENLEDPGENSSFTFVNGKVMARLSADMVALLKSGSCMKFNGANVNLTKFTYYPKGALADEVIWTGDVDITAWSQDVSLGVANIPQAEEGGVITVYATAIGEAPQIQISGNDIAWDWFDIKDPSTNEAYDLTGTSVAIELDGASAETLQYAKKLFVKGCDVEVTKVTYTAPGGTPDPESSKVTPESSNVTPDSSEVTPSGEATVIWEGELELKNWNAPKEPEMEIPDVEV
ncbi:MAG: hypothetical protein IJU04_00535, partial [Ruminococcus sp.]|nr:hypothetical protein [Ruminococcus sp.]